MKVTYRHKRDPCTKDSKDIVENILRMKNSDHEFSDDSKVVTSRKAIILREMVEQEVNIIPTVKNEDMNENTQREAIYHDDCISIEDMEILQPPQELDFDVSDVKDCFEKKKKKRNYIEFRRNYSKSS